MFFCFFFLCLSWSGAECHPENPCTVTTVVTMLLSLSGALPQQPALSQSLFLLEFLSGFPATAGLPSDFLSPSQVYSLPCGLNS